jgi:hypothetical protein
MIKRVLIVLLGVSAVAGVERRSHHRHHHKRPHQYSSISESVEEIQKSFPQYSEKQKQALSKFEDPKIFHEVWKESKNRLHHRMQEIVNKRKHHYSEFDDDSAEM